MMRFSMIRTGIAATAAALALAACGGHGIVPQSSTPGSAFGPTQVRRMASPCNIKGFWYFHGACKTATLTSRGNRTSLPAYRGMAVSIALGANNAKGSVKFIIGDATGNKDITGTYKGMPFPPYGTRTCQKGQKCTGKSAIYLEAFNMSRAAISISAPSQIVFASAHFPGKTCMLSLLESKPAGWKPEAPFLVGAPKNGKLTINIPGGGIFALAPGPAYINLSCS
jgi:hypothetical protein